MKKLFIAILLALSIYTTHAQSGAAVDARHEPHGNTIIAIEALELDAMWLITAKENGRTDRFGEDKFRQKYIIVSQRNLSRVDRDKLRDLKRLLEKNNIYLVK